jgi:hypothetical protein
VLAARAIELENADPADPSSFALVPAKAFVVTHDMSEKDS